MYVCMDDYGYSLKKESRYVELLIVVSHNEKKQRGTRRYSKIPSCPKDRLIICRTAKYHYTSNEEHKSLKVCMSGCLYRFGSEAVGTCT